MGEWADDAFSRLKLKEGAEYEANQDPALKRRQVISDAPYIWGTLLSFPNDEIKDFSAMRPDHLTATQLGAGVMLSSPDADVRVEFAPENPRVTYTVRAKQTPTPTVKVVLLGQSINSEIPPSRLRSRAEPQAFSSWRIYGTD
jgi:hypothetical protein